MSALSSIDQNIFYSFYGNFAERITALQTPLNTRYWRGFIFYFGYSEIPKDWVFMVDRVEAFKNLEILKANQTRLMNYNHLFSSHAFKQDCAAELKKISKQITGIEKQLNA